jgi:hypothetical protein
MTQVAIFERTLGRLGTGMLLVLGLATAFAIATLGV